MWKQKKARGGYNNRGDGRRDYGRDDNRRRDDRHVNDTDRYDDRYSDRQREDDTRDSRYSDVPRQDFDDYRDNRRYGDENWSDSRANYQDERAAPYYEDRVDDRVDYDRTRDPAYREDRGDVYDRDHRDTGYDNAGYSGHGDSDRAYGRDDVYRDSRNYDDVGQDRRGDGQYDYRGEETGQRGETGAILYDDRDDSRDYNTTDYTRDGERREFSDNTYNRPSDNRDADRFNDRRHADGDRVGPADRRQDHRGGGGRRDQARSTSRRGNVTSGQNRQADRQRQVSSGQGRMKITMGRGGAGRNKRPGKGAPVNTSDNRRSSDVRNDKSSSDRQARNTSRDNERAGRGAILRDDRVRSTSSRGSSYRDRSDNKNVHLSGSERRTAESVRSSSRDNKRRQSSSLNIKSENVTSKSNEKTSNKGLDSKLKVDNRSRSKDTERKRRTSENSRRSARDQKSHRSTSRQISDIKQEAIKSFGSFHDDDAISILADDDGFANETSSYFNTDNVESGKIKSEKINDNRMSGRKNTYEGRGQSSRNKESRGMTNKGFSSTRYGSSRYFHKNRSSRITLGRAKGQTSAKDKTSFQNKSSKFSNTSRFNKFKNESNPQSRNISRFGKSFREESTNMKDGLDSNRDDNQNEQVSIQIGRTGAVLSEDRPNDNSNAFDNGRNTNKSMASSRQGNKKTKNSKGKIEYLKARQAYLRNSDKRRDEGCHADDREDRNAPGFNDGLHDMSDQANIDMAQQNQQIIFIPNPEFQDGQLPLIDQFGNPLINPAAVHPGGLQQMPVQFIPSNLAGDLPPGSEYVFIPFDSVGGLPDGNVNFVNNPNIANNMPADDHNNRDTEEKTTKLKPIRNRASKSILLARKRMRLQLKRRRREEFEKKVERRVFSKLMEKAKLQIDTEEKSHQETKPKPVLKRISPPSGTSRQISKHESTVGKGKYDNVSDVEDITDDEDDSGRTRERRPAFRKPGEPRLGIKGRPAPNRMQGDNYEDYERNDTRKVIERPSPKSSHTTQKRNVERKEENFSFAKRLKVDHDLPPIKITVSNEKYNQYEDREQSQENEPYDNRYTRQQRSYDGETKDLNNGDKRMSREVEERGNRRYDTNVSQGPGRNEEPFRQGQADRWQGKYRGNNMPNQRWSRFPGPNNNDNRKSRWTAPNQGSNNNRMQHNRNKTNTSPMVPFSNNQIQQSNSSSFTQQRMSQTQSQINSSLPVQYPHLGYRQFNSDPSLPPVSQGAMNMPSFGQSNFNPQIDMSLPPMAGNVGGSPANMSGGFQSNLPSQNRMQQSVYQSPQQGNNGSLFNQQHQGQNMNMMGGMNQSSSNMNQQKNFQNNMNENQQNFQMNNSPQFQQGSFQMNSGSGNMQQQQSQPMMGGMVGVGSQSQNTYQNSQGNQQSMTGINSSGQNTGQQGYIAARASNTNTSNSANQKFGMVNKSATATNTSIGYAVRPQMLGSVRGGVIKVPSSSMQGGSMAMMQSGAALSVDNRGAVRGAGDRQQAVVQDNMGQQQGREVEEEDDFGELLCSKCDKVFYSESMMRRHTKWHMLADAGVQELRCDNCLEGFTSSVAFGAHMSENHRHTSWMCDQCNLFFVSKIALNRHQARHH